VKKTYLLIIMMIVFVPLGILNNSPAWGEWEAGFFQKTLGFVPKGIAKGSEYVAPMSGYGIRGVDDIWGYYLSAIIGVAIIFAVFAILRRKKHV
jgi:cobalt/nickel transport protein